MGPTLGVDVHIGFYGLEFQKIPCICKEVFLASKISGKFTIVLKFLEAFIHPGIVIEGVTLY